MADVEDRKTGVYIIAHKDDDEKVDEITKLLESKNFRCELQRDAHPGGTEITTLDEELERYSTILLILSKKATMCEWIHYCQAVLADKKHTVPLIVDPELAIADLDPSIRRLVCLKTSEEGYKKKLFSSLRNGGEYCLPVAPIHPGICINYFYGFLDFVLPSFDQDLRRWEEEQNKAAGSSISVVPKMLIMIPESCRCKDRLCQYSKKYVRLYPDEERSTVKCAKNPLDVSRCYDQHVYEITNPDDPSEKYYAVLVLCATMHALWEMKQDGESGINQEKMEEERKGFEVMLAKLLGEHKHCKDRGDVVSFNDAEEKSFVTAIIIKCHEIMSHK